MNRAPLFVLLLVSLAANATMLIALASRTTDATAGWQQIFGRKSSPGPRASRPPFPTVGAGGAGSQVAAEAARRAKLWSTLHTGELRALVPQLQAAGFPPLVIRAIITALVDAQIARRADEQFGSPEAMPYWKADSFTGFGFYTDPKKSEAFFQLSRERNRQLRELIGDDMGAYFADPTAEQRRRYGNLSPAKIDRLQRINDDYAEMTSELRAAGGGVTLPEDREKFRLLEEERKADLAAALSPQEFEDYESRTHYMTARLRSAMATMDATEAEFRAIFRAQKVYQENLRLMSTTEAHAAGAFTDELGPMQQQLQQQLKAALGDQRYAEYSRAMNNEFQQLMRLSQSENIAAETALRVFSLRDGVAHDSNRIFADATLTTEQKRAALQTLAQQTRAQIVSALGPKAGPAYAQSTRWLTLVERGSAVTFGPENMMTSKKLPDPPAPGTSPKR